MPPKKRTAEEQRPADKRRRVEKDAEEEDDAAEEAMFEDDDDDDDGDHSHENGCDDAECDGCAEGEIVIEFPEGVVPPAVDLFKLAFEEMHGGNVGAAQKLFEMSFEAYENESALPANANREFYYTWGTAELEFAVFKDVHQFASLAIERFDKALTLPADGDSPRSDKDLFVALGRAHFELARLLHAEAVMFEQGDDEEEAEEEGESAARRAEEAEHVTKGNEFYAKGIAACKTDKERAEEIVLYGQTLQAYAEGLFDEPERQHEYLDQAISKFTDALKINPNDTYAIGRRGIAYLQKAHAMEEDDDDGDDEDGDGEGSAEGEPKEKTPEAIARDNERRKLLEKAAEMIGEALSKSTVDDEKFMFHQKLGQAFLEISTIEDDEDKTQTLVQNGLTHYRKALELNPECEELREIISQIEEDGSATSFSVSQNLRA